MNHISVLIVEDEPHAQNELKRLLAKSGHDVHVLDCIDSVEEAINWINKNEEPDILFFDIQLSDGLSFEIFKHIKTKTPVIFTTAFDEYAIQAFKVNSVDYLLKPIKQHELTAALDKFKALKDEPKNKNTGLRLEQIEELLKLHKPHFKTRFITRIGDQIKQIDINEVAYFKAEDNEVLLITGNNKRYFVNYALDQLSGLIDPVLFFRANRSYFVHISSIKKISKYFNSRLHIELEPATEEPVLISRVKVPEFLNWIDK
ncbi:MAG: LytTR family DNA-binding domain-containing protein [Bacteroidales bacterium]|nr:LytTR family DNA-binding domain-containing protein [Bacteroidales bacterium]